MRLKNILYYILLQILGFLGLVVGFRVNPRPEPTIFTNVPSFADSTLDAYVAMHEIFIAALIASLFVIGAAKIFKKSILPAFFSILLTFVFLYVYNYVDTGYWPFFGLVSSWGAIIGIVFTVGLFCVLENIVAFAASKGE